MAGKVAKGIAWSAIERFSVQGVSFCLSIIIARLISPSAYGVIAILNVFLSFSQLFIDSGFGNALIQKKDRTDVDYSTTLIYSMGVALLLYAILFAGAPFVASFYNDETLCPLLRVMSLNLIFSSMSIVQRCRLTINLDFKTQTKASIVAVIVSGSVGVACAYSGLGAWALVIQSVICNSVLSICLFRYSKWMPQMVFSKESFNKLFSFGSKQLMGNIITSLYMNITNLVIGKVYTPADLGFYNRGFTLAQFPSSYIVSILSRVTYPVECELQSNPEELKRAHYRYLRLNCYIIFPMMLLVCVLARPIIVTLLTDKWEPAAFFLSVMCIAFIWQPMNYQIPLIFDIMGRPGINLAWGIPKRIITFLSMIIGLPYGPEGIAIGLAISNFVEVAMSAYMVQKYVGYSGWAQFTSVGNIAISASAMAFLAYLSTLITDNNILKLILGCTVGAVSYLAFTFMFNMSEKSIWQSSFNYINKFRKR